METIASGKERVQLVQMISLRLLKNINAGLKPEESLIAFYKEQIRLDQVNKLQHMQEMKESFRVDINDSKSLINSSIIEIFESIRLLQLNLMYRKNCVRQFPRKLILYF